jgi:PhoH-like ATPase
MKKNYVLDTNVLLYDPQAIFRFEDNDVVIPIYVIEEVDQFKRESSERGRNARTVARLLDGLRERGSLAQGVALDTKGSLKIAIPAKRPILTTALDHSAQDQAILQTAIDVRDASPAPTIFVTMDSNLRIRADALGLAAETYENLRVEVDQLDSGVMSLDVDGSVVDLFFQEGSVPPPAGHDLYPNVCVLLRDRSAPSHSALGRYDGPRDRITPLRVPREGVMGIRPRNKEQTYALDLLLDDSIRLVTLVGKAGTGKTLLALAGGLKRTVEDGAYLRLLVSRPVMPLGRDIGYLPGDIDEKLNPWMQPIFDNLEFLFSTGSGRGREPRGFAELLETGQIQVEPLTYIRGRSLPQQYVIVDEAQNLTPHEVKTIVTRCGEGTKIVLTGDPFQIDNPYVDAATNGLTYAANRMHAEALVGHIVLTKGERSPLANLAAAKL